MCAPIGKYGGYSCNSRYSLAYQMDRCAWQLPSATHLNSQEERDPRNLLASFKVVRKARDRPKSHRENLVKTGGRFQASSGLNR